MVYFCELQVTNQILPFGRDPDTPTIITAKGDTWKGLRHVLTPAFSAKKLKLVSSDMSNITNCAL